MREFLYLDCTPSDEDCAQVGKPGYWNKAVIECEVMIDYLERLYPDMPGSVYIEEKTNTHDAGTYWDLRIYFNEDDEEASDFAYDLQNNYPEKWDEIALAKLREAGYFETVFEVVPGDLQKEKKIKIA